jgi:NADH:ubiquinone oxidoreductase subunit E
VACIGVCTLAPNVVINSQVYGDMDLEKVKELFKKGES